MEMEKKEKKNPSFFKSKPEKKSKNLPSALFPIPTDSTTTSWPNLFGKYNGNCIVVEDNASISTLYFKGYFGKGSLSRSEPNFHPDRAKTKIQLPKDDSNRESEEVEDLTACSCSEVGEQLHLFLEEAFFLSFGLGCLQVDHNGTLLNLDQMWTLYCNSKKDFPPRYAAYHHFRSSGWVVRSGIKYGSDFLLYKQGPDYNHASYSVKVIPRSASHQTDKGHLSWIDFSGLNRITETASKELVLCYVEFPDNEIILSSPKCLKRFSIQESVWKRWVASQERDELKAA